MKRLANVLTAFVFVATLTACGFSEASPSEMSNDSSVDMTITDTMAGTESDPVNDTVDEFVTHAGSDPFENTETEDDLQEKKSSNTRMFAMGRPFPDFTVETTDGPFTFSEALEGKEVMMINFWGTWCGYCTYEFPFIEEAYEKSDGKFGVIALSVDPGDTIDKIKKYKDRLDLTFPMGSDASSLFSLLRENGVPVSVFVDRFGNVVYKQIGCFSSEEDLNRLLDTLMGDDYTETQIIE